MLLQVIARSVVFISRADKTGQIYSPGLWYMLQELYFLQNYLYAAVILNDQVE